MDVRGDANAVVAGDGELVIEDPTGGGRAAAVDTGKRRRGEGEPRGGELAGGSYRSRPHREPPEEEESVLHKFTKWKSRNMGKNIFKMRSLL